MDSNYEPLLLFSLLHINNKCNIIALFVIFLIFVPLIICKGIAKNKVRDISLNKLAALTLLMTFLIGQFIVYTHSHESAALSIVDCSPKKHHADHPKCSICDQNSHPQLLFHFSQSEILLPEQEIAFGFVVPSDQMISALLSGNRGPPLC